MQPQHLKRMLHWRGSKRLITLILCVCCGTLCITSCADDLNPSAAHADQAPQDGRTLQREHLSGIARGRHSPQVLASGDAPPHLYDQINDVKAKLDQIHDSLDFGSLDDSLVSDEDIDDHASEASNGRLFHMPLLYKYAWLHDCLSLLHAMLCIVCYSLLAAKIIRDKTAIGLSIQTICALTVSEWMGLGLTLMFSFKYSISFEWSFYCIDCVSSVLSLFCLYVCLTRFNTSYEEQYDTFGLNICNRCLMYAGSSLIDRTAFKTGVRAGMLKPTGMWGRISSMTYWLVLYALAIPIALLFTSFRSVISLERYILFLLAYDDAIRAVAILPQLYMFHLKRPRKVSEHLAIFVMCEFALKATSLAYWLLLPLFRPYVNETRLYNTAVQLLNLIALGDFAYHYIRSKLRGETGLTYSKEIAIPLRK